MKYDLAAADLKEYDKTHIWHPYTSMLSPLPCYMVDSAQGVYIRLENGQKLIDGMSSWWAVIHGYNNPYLNKAVENQLKKMSHIMFGGLTHRPAIELARRLIDMTPAKLEHIFFCDSGSVAVEVAMKMALQYWQSIGMCGKCKFVTARSGYHGDTWHAMSVCDPDKGMHRIYNGRLSVQLFVDSPMSKFNGEWLEDDLIQVKSLFKNRHDEIAAFIIEPIVQGTGGMRFYHPRYLKELKKLCEQYNILLILDEIATGFGRTGKMFASEWAGICPDIMCLGKAITGGYMSFASTLATGKVAFTISEGVPGEFMHGPTFMANPLACAVANASLDLIESQNIPEKVKIIEQRLKTGLSGAWSIPEVKDIRVLGAIGVIEVIEDVDVGKIQCLFVKNNIWVRPFGKLIYIMPPYIISLEELDLLMKNLINTIREYYAKGA